MQLWRLIYNTIYVQDLTDIIVIISKVYLCICFLDSYPLFQSGVYLFILSFFFAKTIHIILKKME